jgi:geranylgeranylglycerol-phosphate geranylgeranyltransferase
VQARASVQPWLSLFRVGNSVTGIFGVFLGSILASRGLPSGEYAVITFFHSFSVMLFMFSWNAINDYLDIEIDRINRPNRPLPSGAIASTSAKRGIQITALLSLSSLMAAGYVSFIGEMGVKNWIPSLIIWILALFLLFNYESGSRFSYGMKDKGLPGNIAISISVGLVIILGAASVSKPFDDRAWIVFLIGFLYNLSREIVKDIEDMDGDRGRDTFAMSAGVDRARSVAAVLLVLALVAMLSPFLPFFHIFTDWHVIFVIPSVVSLMMVKPRLFSEEDHHAQKLIKSSMQLCLLAFLVISLIPS